MSLVSSKQKKDYLYKLKSIKKLSQITDLFKQFEILCLNGHRRHC